MLRGNGGCFSGRCSVRFCDIALGTDPEGGSLGNRRNRWSFVLGRIVTVHLAHCGGTDSHGCHLYSWFWRILQSASSPSYLPRIWLINCQRNGSQRDVPPHHRRLAQIFRDGIHVEEKSRLDWKKRRNVEVYCWKTTVAYVTRAHADDRQRNLKSRRVFSSKNWGIGLDSWYWNTNQRLRTSTTSYRKRRWNRSASITCFQ